MSETYSQRVWRMLMPEERSPALMQVLHEADAALAQLQQERDNLMDVDRKREAAFQRVIEQRTDAIRQLRVLQQERDALQWKYDELVDLPLCRLQLPDGSVPSNTREALEAWHREAMRFWKERDADRKSALANYDKLCAVEQERDALLEALEHVVAVLPSPIWNEHQVLVWSQLDIEKMRAALATSQRGA